MARDLWDLARGSGTDCDFEWVLREIAAIAVKLLDLFRGSQQNGVAMRPWRNRAEIARQTQLAGK